MMVENKNIVEKKYKKDDVMEYLDQMKNAEMLGDLEYFKETTEKAYSVFRETANYYSNGIREFISNTILAAREFVKKYNSNPNAGYILRTRRDASMIYFGVKNLGDEINKRKEKYLETYKKLEEAKLLIKKLEEHGIETNNIKKSLHEFEEKLKELENVEGKLASAINQLKKNLNDLYFFEV